MSGTATTPARQRRSAPTTAQAIVSANKHTKGVKVGRPLTYSPELCDRAVALGMAGKHWAAIARAFGVDKSTLTKWSGEYPDFSHALSRAKAYSQAWWEDKVQQKLGAKHFQANSARLVMSGQFREDYAEQRSAADLGFDLGAFVGALGAAVKLGQQQPGDQAKVVDPLEVVTETPHSTPTKR